jgi:putative ABC transport system permease protein
VTDIRERGLQLNMKPAVYLPFTQVTRPSPDYLIVRAQASAEDVTGRIRQAIWSVDPEQPITKVLTMREYIDLELNNRRDQMRIFVVFAGLALFLAALGVYGVVAYSVEQRRREIGLRVALGATMANIVSLVFRQGLGLTSIGIVIGLGIAFASTRALKSLLYGVKPVDTATFLLGVTVLLFSVMMACLLPARAASRVDPAVTLRNE